MIRIVLAVVFVATIDPLVATAVVAILLHAMGTALMALEG
jgi:hypothetical protein